MEEAGPGKLAGASSWAWPSGPALPAALRGLSRRAGFRQTRGHLIHPRSFAYWAILAPLAFPHPRIGFLAQRDQVRLDQSFEPTVATTPQDTAALIDQAQRIRPHPHPCLGPVPLRSRICVRHASLCPDPPGLSSSVRLRPHTRAPSTPRFRPSIYLHTPRGGR